MTASGSVQPVGNLNVQSPIQRYSKTIQITEGTYVEKGDLLIELDTQALEIDENQLNSQKNFLNQQEVYTKIKDGNELSEIIDEYDIDSKSYSSYFRADLSYKNTFIWKDKSNAI